MWFFRGNEKMSNNATETLIAVRQKTHGDFRDVGRVSQKLKEIMKTSPNWNKLPPHQQEGLEMNAHKVARILCGDPNFKEHWDDIAGYATRVAGYLSCAD